MYRNPTLGTLLKALNNYKKLDDEEKKLIDQFTSIHKNEELLKKLIFLNKNFRNTGAHDEHFPLPHLEELFKITFSEPEKLLIQFIENMDCTASNN